MSRKPVPASALIGMTKRSQAPCWAPTRTRGLERRRRLFWAIGGTRAGGELAQDTRGAQRVRAAVATPVRCRGALSAAWAVWRAVCRRSVGTVADASAPAGPAGRLSTKRSDVSAGHGRARTGRDDLDEIRVSYGSEGWGFESLRARCRKPSDLHKRAHWK